jgi:hypothetical protein
MLKRKSAARPLTRTDRDSQIGGVECRLLEDGRLVVTRKGERLHVSKVYVIASTDGGSGREADVALVVRPEQEASQVQNLLDALFTQLTDPSPKARRKKVEIAADEELTLRCGKSSITLTKSGKVIVRGTKIVSRATGEHKIRGALVSLN